MPAIDPKDVPLFLKKREETTQIGFAPVTLNLSMTASPMRGLDMLKRLDTFAQELRSLGLVVEIEGYLNVKVTAMPSKDPDAGQ